MSDLDPALTLGDRAALPDALRVLLAEYPRDGWQAHRNFQGLVSFWLERHMMFRKLMEMMRADTQGVLDRTVDPQQYAARLSRYGGMFVQQLHGHHTIEDTQYFPVLAHKEPRIEKGFAILEGDHHALDGHLDRFVKGANAVLQRIDDRAVIQTRAGRFHDDLQHLESLLDRHLLDEEELIVPVILRHGAGSLG